MKQVRKAPGFITGELLRDRNWTYWTMTAWSSQESMRGYITTGAHKSAMTRLLDWCDEASITHWIQPETALPTWTEADKRMREEGRPSKVRHPSPRHASLTYEIPGTTTGTIIRPD